MKKFVCILMLICSQAFANSEISQTLIKEWRHLRTQVETLKADGELGEMLYKDYGAMTLLWMISDSTEDNEVIRFFLARKSGEVFAITYHKSDIIFPGRVVLRRFIGPEPIKWVNHTVDFQTAEYLGQQGETPELNQEEMDILKTWKITLF